MNFLWHINETGCTVNLRGSYTSLDGYGSTPGESATIDRVADPVPGVKTQVARATFTPSGTNVLAPGDSMILGFYRESSSDTCFQSLYIKGIQVVYE